MDGVSLFSCNLSAFSFPQGSEVLLKETSGSMACNRLAFMNKQKQRPHSQTEVCPRPSHLCYAFLKIAPPTTGDDDPLPGLFWWIGAAGHGLNQPLPNNIKDKK